MAGKLVTERGILSYPKGIVNPEDLLNFYPFPGFEKRWAALGLTPKDQRALEVAIMTGPKNSQMIKGTGALRKIRFAPRDWNVGKSGALRIGYAYSEQESIVLLVTAYSKHDNADLSPSERRKIKRLLKEAWKRVY